MAYADENYKQEKDLYDSLAQVFDTYKYGAVHAAKSWNMPTNEISGVTMRLVGENLVEFNYHRFEVTSVDGLRRIIQDDNGLKFLKSVASAIKKEFKGKTGKELTLKVVKEYPADPQKAGRLTAETSWMLGSSRNGGGNRPLGRYLLKTSCVYEFSANL